ncbi:L-serine ammonia-lyase, iron-sulfur-dependent subunit beta [Youngiibacter multivorans]|uniref:L-serine deaminase n=1 Tax=Youngiibacter multivorans TaxID=937251 RepID=A0ABS4G5G4_9CLOT|nr:L-serine ammonia-lyase, iron-sulfur-dependent subunit beta [Youngiibacter multivorans]MBP1919778.1 L-serine dehydratase [Youngiibacter multivorans]
MQKKYGIFDIIGPVMIGPSSSHTAGAARIGRIARLIAGSEIVKADFILHGSFSKTYRGHGTDRALVAGILGMLPDDDRLRDSMDLAKEAGISISFREGSLGDVHPNTVRIDMTLADGEIISVTGSSIGGGAVLITRIGDEDVQFTGNYPTLLITHTDSPGVVAHVTRLLYEASINIAFMSVFRSQRGKSATMIFETDENIPEGTLEKLKDVSGVGGIRFLPVASDSLSYPVTT